MAKEKPESTRYCTTCGRACEPRIRICKGCGAKTLVKHVYLYSTVQYNNLVTTWKNGGLVAAAKQSKWSLEKTAETLARSRAYSIRIPPKAAAWLAAHPETTNREAASYLQVSPSTISRWRAALNNLPARATQRPTTPP